MFALFFVGYLIGSIPFGLLLTKLAGLGDIRDIGSGNIGATNVLRTGSKKLAALTLLLDALKGAIPILLLIDHGVEDPAVPENFSYIIAMLLGLGAVLGHMFPPWLKFKGGKGVATTLGVLLAAVPLAGLTACATWIAVALVFRISSVAALAALLAAPVVTYPAYGAEPAFLALVISALVWIRHRDNIKRLLNGEEPRIGKKKD